MKLFKLIPALSVITLGFAPIAFTTSCNKDKTSEDTKPKDFEVDVGDYANYIYARSFSIMKEGYKSGTTDKYNVYGTGWILADATLDKSDDYVYYMATNWHVIGGFNQIDGSTYKYADKSLSGGKSIISRDNYLNFNSFILMNNSQFKYPTQTSSYYVDAVDFYVAKVDFGNPSGEIKTKLDNLNTLQSKQKCINKFIETENEFKQNNKYIGGFPFKESGSLKGGKWEVHGIKSSAFNFYSKNHVYETGTRPGHSIGEKATDPLYNTRDVSPQLVLSSDATTSYLTGGSSGSLVIDSNYKVCGIYWGGWQYSDGTYHPAISYIKDFVKTSYTE